MRKYIHNLVDGFTDETGHYSVTFIIMGTFDIDVTMQF